MQARDDCGTIVSGITDLLLELEDGFVVIDHKSFPGNLEYAVKKAQGFAAQLAEYAKLVVAATGKQVLACFIHMPVLGIVIPVDPALDTESRQPAS